MDDVDEILLVHRRAVVGARDPVDDQRRPGGRCAHADQPRLHRQRHAGNDRPVERDVVLAVERERLRGEPLGAHERLEGGHHREERRGHAADAMRRIVVVGRSAHSAIVAAASTRYGSDRTGTPSASCTAAVTTAPAWRPRRSSSTSSTVAVADQPRRELAIEVRPASSVRRRSAGRARSAAGSRRAADCRRPGSTAPFAGQSASASQATSGDTLAGSRGSNAGVDGGRRAVP